MSRMLPTRTLIQAFMRARMDETVGRSWDETRPRIFDEFVGDAVLAPRGTGSVEDEPGIWAVRAVERVPAARPVPR